MAEPNVHLAIASGGTGGHFFPTLAIAREFRRQGGEVTLLVAGHHSREQLEIAKEHELPACEVRAVRLPGTPLATLTFGPRFLASVLTARRQLKQLRPDLVLGMGSFASVPASLAAASRRIPLVLHEGNAQVGRANRFLSRWSRALATSLPLLPGAAPGRPHTRTGMPLRDSIIQGAGREAPVDGFHRDLGLETGKPVLLVFGGSQGARSINELMTRTAALLGDDAGRFQVIHLTGSEENDAIVDAYADAGLQASVRKADHRIENCYLAADLVLCRGGASTISELALFGKPAILIPLPSAAEDHQTANARVIADTGAARLQVQAETTPEILVALLRDWLQAPDEWRVFGEKIRRLACPQAAEAVVELLWTTIGVHPRGTPGAGAAP